MVLGAAFRLVYDVHEIVSLETVNDFFNTPSEGFLKFMADVVRNRWTGLQTIHPVTFRDRQNIERGMAITVGPFKRFMNITDDELEGFMATSGIDLGESSGTSDSEMSTSWEKTSSTMLASTVTGNPTPLGMTEPSDMPYEANDAFMLVNSVRDSVNYGTYNDLNEESLRRRSQLQLVRRSLSIDMDLTGPSSSSRRS